MRKHLVLSVVLCFILGFSVIAGKDNPINAFIVNYGIILKGGSINETLENPILSYDDRTYISVRDVAKVFEKNVVWDNESEDIVLIENNEKPVIWDYDTAKFIGQAIIHQFFPDEVKDSTTYEVSRAQADHPDAKPIFIVCATFDTDVNVNADNPNFDVIVEINSITGRILSVSRYIEGRMKYFYPWVRAD